MSRSIWWNRSLKPSSPGVVPAWTVSSPSTQSAWTNSRAKGSTAHAGSVAGKGSRKAKTRFVRPRFSKIHEETRMLASDLLTPALVTVV